MDLALIGNYAVWILEVAFGLGFVIFVHELGHFAVAKACGVKCEKFYLGFDIYGLKLFKMQWGETEYGIGILPLGGYVKMLGQDDNPTRAAEERERSLVKTGAPPEASANGSSAAADAKADGLLDPRSYMAQSVPERMAIISAGVIMNVIFAFLMAVVAYRIGVPSMPCAIGGVLPGDPAWQAGMQAGDEILEINGVPPEIPLRFRDLQTAVVLGNPEEGVRFKVRRTNPDNPEDVQTIELTVTPESPAKSKDDRLAPMIGVMPSRKTTLNSKEPVAKESPAAGKFEPDDKIAGVDDKEIKSYAQLGAELVRHTDDPLTFKVERTIKKKDGSSEDQAEEELAVKVGPNPLRTLGLVMKMGEITAIQDKSPAQAAGFEVGDTLVSFDGQPVGDPFTLPQRMRELAGKTITIEIARPDDGKTETLSKEVVLRGDDWPESDVLGIAYTVSNVIEAIDPDGPAAKAEVMKEKKPADAARLAAGDIVVKAEFLPKDPKAPTDVEKRLAKLSFKFGETANWPYFMDAVEQASQQTPVKLTLKDGRTVEIVSDDSTKWFTPERGFLFQGEAIDVKAPTWRAAVIMGWRETGESLSQVYRFIQKIFSGQISSRGLGGPLSIAGAATEHAKQGVSALLLFLTMLSANLAVINFLPIPLLDGGHMLFLALEGIFRRPVSERVVVACHYLGFTFIIGLMLFVLSLDFGIIPRHQQAYQRSVRVAATAPLVPGDVRIV